ncbi:MAG: lipopolysaccharide biosynthesis protein [Planctomycetes bacterium]|nr:lipopolysaccharide biosynthesis protein [Planctomycetota bacterium]
MPDNSKSSNIPEPVTVPPMKDKALKGIGAVFLSQAATRVIKLVYQILLANFLLQVEMGIVAISDTLLGVLQNLANFGISQAVIQSREDDEEKLLATGFWMRFFFGVVTAVVIFIIAPYWAEHNHNSAITDVVRIFALNLVLASAGFAAHTNFTKHIQFKPIAICQVIATFVSCSAGIIIVILLPPYQRYWGMVFSGVIFTVVFSTLIIWKGRNVPLRKFDFRLALGLFGYGKFLFVASILSVVVNYYDNWFVSQITGSLSMVGIYYVAYTWGNRVVTDIVHNFSGVLFPAMSRLQSEPERFRKAYLDTLKYITIIVTPISLGLLVLAGHFVYGVLGPKWADAIAPLRIFCLFAIFRAIGVTNTNALNAAGKAKLLAVIPVLFIALSIAPLILLTKAYGIAGTAVALLLTVIVTTSLSSYFANRTVNAGFRAFWDSVYKPLFCALIMAGFVYALDAFTMTGYSKVKFILLGLSGAIVYVLAGALLMPETVAEIFSLMKRVIKKTSSE